MQKRIYWNDGWKFKETYENQMRETAYQDDAWEDVRLPHTCKETPFHYFDERSYQMVCCYRKHFFSPEEWKDQTVIVTFEGIAHEAQVFLNGERIGEHHCGYTAFSIDISKKLRIGAENVLTVRVDSRENLNIPPFGYVIDYMTYGGIYREAYVDLKNETYLADIFLHSEIPEGQKPDAKLISEIEIKNSGRTDEKKEFLIRQSIRERGTENYRQIGESRVASDRKLSFPISDIKLWDLETPVLYEVKTEITEWKTKSRNESGDTKKESVQTLAEDGLYKLRMNVTDMAGNVSHAERQLIIDKENPVIAHVDELDGKYLKKFSWNYSIEESIKDFTNYTYVMKVDDAFYRPGEKIEKEGVHVLTIEAFDSAGNKGEAKARFTIDHTPPVIEFEGIEDGEKYEKEKTFYVRTENLEDQIEYIKINGKKQNRKKQKKGYEIQLNEAKNYEIEVKAKDFAGNEKVSQIGFEIYEEKSLWQKIVEPVRKYIFYGNEKVIQDEKMVKEDKKEGKKKNIILWERAVLFGALIVVGIWKREKVKEIWKNLS